MTPPLLYIDSDIPAGMTLVDWRRAQVDLVVPRTWWRRLLGLG
jgi:hypothetical protein